MTGFRPDVAHAEDAVVRAQGDKEHGGRERHVEREAARARHRLEHEGRHAQCGGHGQDIDGHQVERRHDRPEEQHQQDEPKRRGHQDDPTEARLGLDDGRLGKRGIPGEAGSDVRDAGLDQQCRHGVAKPVQVADRGGAQRGGVEDDDVAGGVPSGGHHRADANAGGPVGRSGDEGDPRLALEKGLEAVERGAPVADVGALDQQHRGRQDAWGKALAGGLGGPPGVEVGRERVDDGEPQIEVPYGGCSHQEDSGTHQGHQHAIPLPGDGLDEPAARQRPSPASDRVSARSARRPTARGWRGRPARASRPRRG